MFDDSKMCHVLGYFTLNFRPKRIFSFYYVKYWCCWCFVYVNEVECSGTFGVMNQETGSGKKKELCNTCKRKLHYSGAISTNFQYQHLALQSFHCKSSRYMCVQRHNYSKLFQQWCIFVLFCARTCDLVSMEIPCGKFYIVWQIVTMVSPWKHQQVVLFYRTVNKLEATCFTIIYRVKNGLLVFLVSALQRVNWKHENIKFWLNPCFAKTHFHW